MSSSSESPARVSSTTERSETPKSGTVATKHPVQVQRRNARERNRVRQVNQGFVTLRNHVPAGTKNKKLSKVETLRQAASYIQYLREVLTSNGDSIGAPPPPPYYPQQSSCYPTTSMAFPAYPHGLPPPGDFTSENLSPGSFYPGANGYGHFSQEYSMNPPPGAHVYGSNPVSAAALMQDYGMAQHMGGFQHHKVSPPTGSDPSPSNSSFMSDNSYEMALSPQEAKYSEGQTFVQYS